MSSGSAADPPLVAGRACDGCTLCCTLLDITELGKPGGTDCPHAGPQGCTIYAARPFGCRTFYCGWLALPFVADHWRPRQSGMVVFPDAAGKALTVHVDPALPDAWRAAPYRADLSRWAVVAAQMGMEVRVAVGRDLTVILPDGERHIGIAAD